MTTEQRYAAAIARAAVEIADLLAYDILHDLVPPGIDVPDDYETGIHHAAQRIKAALREPPDST